MDRNVLLNFHKVKPTAFGNIQKKRELESNKLKNDRHARRTDRFNSRRNMGNEEDLKLDIVKEVLKKNISVEASKVLDRKLALQKFKKEKDALQKASKKNARPPFVVGIPHHGSSPLLRDLTNHDCVTNKHRPAKQEFTFKPKKVESIKKLTSPHTPTVLKRSAKKIPTLLANPSRKNIAVTNRLNKSTSSSSSGEMLALPLLEVEVNAASPVQKEEPSPSPNASPQQREKQTIDMCTEAESNEIEEFVLSPNVETRRGKLSDRKRTPSAKMPLHELQNPDAEFHRNRLDDETRRLLSLADVWEPLALQPQVPREVIDEIDSLVGQTRLLTRDKFKQFRGLVDQFETGATTAASVHPITRDDLDGFWEMMYLQVEPLIKRYSELEILKNNNWEKSKNPTPPRKKRRIVVKSKATPGPSAALRAAMRARKTRTNQVTPLVIQESMKTPTTDRSIVVNTFLSSAAQPRNSNSPYIAMRLSGIGRSIGRSSIIGMETSDQSTTPKSAMKRNVKQELSESVHKTVLFDKFSKGDVKDTSDMSGVIESQNITIKSEPTEVEEDEDFRINLLFNLQANVSEAMSVKTPRRSARLLGKTPTPMKSRLCGACLSPKCDSEECKKENIKKRSLRKSRKTCKFDLSPSERNQIDDDTAAANVLDTLEESGEAPKPVGKRFALRPSNLVVSEKPVGTNAEGSRRSVRICNARKVTFDAGTEEKRSFKLPSTPYRKSGVHQFHEDSHDD